MVPVEFGLMFPPCWIEGVLEEDPTVLFPFTTLTDVPTGGTRADAGWVMIAVIFIRTLPIFSMGHDKPCWRGITPGMSDFSRQSGIRGANNKFDWFSSSSDVNGVLIDGT